MKYSDLGRKKNRKKRKWFSDWVTPLGIKLGGLAKYWGSDLFYSFFYLTCSYNLQDFVQSSVNTSFYHLLILNVLATCSCAVLYLHWVSYL